MIYKIGFLSKLGKILKIKEIFIIIKENETGLKKIKKYPQDASFKVEVFIKSYKNKLN